MYFVECTLTRICLISFLMNKQGLLVFFFGKKKSCRGKMSFSSHHIKGTYFQHYLSLLILITWLIQCLCVFSTVKLYPPAFHTLLFGKDSVQQTLKGWGGIYIKIIWIFLKFWCVYSSLNLFILIISFITMDSWIFVYSLSYKLI